MEKEGNQIEKSPLYLEKLLKLSILKQAWTVRHCLGKGRFEKRAYSARLMLNRLMKIIAKRSVKKLKIDQGAGRKDSPLSPN